MKKRDALKAAGLTDSQIDVYIALLRESPATVSELADLVDIHRTNIYDILETLQEQGLVSSFNKDSIKRFNAAPPERIVDHLQETTEQVQNIVPDLKSLSPDTEQPRVDLYQGKRGLKTVVRDFLDVGQDLRFFGQNKFSQLFPEFYIETVAKKMNKRQIAERMLIAADKDLKTVEHGQYRTLPDKYLYPAGIMVYGDTTAFLLWREPYHAVCIQDKHLSSSFKQHFEVLWELAGNN